MPNLNTSMKDEKTIIANALENIQKITLIQNVNNEWANSSLYDADVSIDGIQFAVEIKKNVTKANYLRILEHLRHIKFSTSKPVLLIGDYVSPTVFHELRKDGFNVLDSSGNCQISEGNLYIYVKGQKQTVANESLDKAFNETGVKLIFYILLDKDNISKSYRMIHTETNLSLGTIKNVVEDLNVRKFVAVASGKRIIMNRKSLINQWQEAYNKVLKPKLFVGKMKFVNNESKRQWNTINLPTDMFWGGESGANALDGYLQPELFTIYSDTSMRDLLKTGRVVPANDGEIFIYRKFWKQNIDNQIAPKLLIYADLMGSGNSRCLEAAQKLIENGI